MLCWAVQGQEQYLWLWPGIPSCSNGASHLCYFSGNLILCILIYIQILRVFVSLCTWCRHKLPYRTAPKLTHHPNWVPLCKMLMDDPTFWGDVHVAAGWYYLYKLFGWVCWSVSSFVSVYGLWLWSVACNNS